jgi:hypothetical protein
MLAQIKLICGHERFDVVKPTDYVMAPEKPVKKRRATKPKPTHISELDDSMEPMFSDDEV